MERINSTLKDHGLEPITCKSVLYYYAPMKGSAGFVILGSQMISPELYENFQFLVVPRLISLTNGCLLTSLVGSGLYLYSRPHLQPLTSNQKIMYSAFGSAVFNLGSVLGWALCRSVLKSAQDEATSSGGVVFRAVLGAAGAVGALSLARGYLSHVDKLAGASSKSRAS